MKIPEDFREFIELLNGHNVHYLIVGGYAVSFHSRPKFTNDIDIWIESTAVNARKVLIVLKAFGFGDLESCLSAYCLLFFSVHACLASDSETGITRLSGIGM